jgi:transcriptional regulator with XRE-family HTH domain
MARLYRIRYTWIMSVADLIARRRTELSLTQGQLAERSGTSRERINTYERSKVYPTTDTLERVLGAMRVEVTTVPAMTYEERRSLAISTAVARRLTDLPAETLAKARGNLARMRDSATHEHRWIRVWESVLDLGAPHVASLLTSTDQFARDLRQSSPFAGVLTEVERAASISGLRR